MITEYKAVPTRPSLAEMFCGIAGTDAKWCSAIFFRFTVSFVTTPSPFAERYVMRTRASLQRT